MLKLRFDRYIMANREFKVAQYNNSVATPSIFESLIFKQIDRYDKTIITHVLHIDDVIDLDKFLLWDFIKFSCST